MWVSTPQIITSLERLSGLHPFFGYAFLGFKRARLPVGHQVEFSYHKIREYILEPYFRIIPESQQFFNPFKTVSRWVGQRYDSTSLQRVVADTFGEAFLHEKKSSHWGWSEDYVGTLRRIMSRTQSSDIPLLDLAVWIYRDDGNVPDVNAAEYLIEKIISEFDIRESEVNSLCDASISNRIVELSPSPTEPHELLNIIGWPDDVIERSGVSLERLELRNVGPSRRLIYSPSPRLNLIAGDNSLGKTFLLECAWWALTGQWVNYPAEPRSVGSRPVRVPADIRYRARTPSGRRTEALSPFSPIEAEWQRGVEPMEGLGIFAMHTGSVALWDPLASAQGAATAHRAAAQIFTREAIWDGLAEKDIWGRPAHRSNGLVRDLVAWQVGGERHIHLLRAFQRSVRALSPPGGPPLRFGPPVRLPQDSRDIPTLMMPYGLVPVVHASAGVQRALALAYMLVWHWEQHVERARLYRREPVRQMVVMLDEVEAHLHPRWQRQILPALMKVFESLSEELVFQVHVATHSPLVLASAEPLFNPHLDRMHHLTLSDRDVQIEAVQFSKHGSVDSWLESDTFGLQDARSTPAEEAISAAKRLQIELQPDRQVAAQIHTRLLRYLPDDDPFWVRWNFFYEKLIEGGSN